VEIREVVVVRYSKVLTVTQDLRRQRQLISQVLLLAQPRRLRLLRRGSRASMGCMG
jgi:hypothetical protein